MPIARRRVIRALAATPLAACQSTPIPHLQETPAMYGLIGKFRCHSGQRDALAAILAEGTGAMPGCLSYVIAADSTEPDGLWVTEVWDSAASHKASLALPAVKQAIARGRPLIAGFGERFETRPLGGMGLAGK